MRLKTTLYFLFFLSGLAGLIHEVIWLRLFSLTFGNTTQAGAVVLGAFMGGLAIGAWTFGKRADATLRPARMYALLEIAVAMTAGLLLVGHLGADWIYAKIFHVTGSGSFLLFLPRLIISFVLMVVPCALMGGTLPVLVRAAAPTPDQSGTRTGILYAINTVGAVCGAVFAGFAAIEYFGVYQTAAIGIALNLLAGIAAFVLFSKDVSPLPIEKPVEIEPNESDTKIQNAALVLAAAAGFSALALEVMYTRLILFVITYSVYAWSIVLTVFLVGIAAGSAAFARKSKRVTDPLKTGAIALMMSAAGMWFSLIAISRYDGLTRMIWSLFHKQNWDTFVLFEFLLVFCTLFLPTFFSGMAFPFLVRAFVGQENSPGRKVGRFYAFNTLGAIAGSLLAGFVIVPTLGAQSGIFWTAAALYGLAAFHYISGQTHKPRRQLPILIGVILALLGFIIPGNQLISKLLTASRTPGLTVMVEEDINATVAIYDTGGFRELAVNGVQVAGTDLAMRTTQILQGHIPMMIHEAPKNVLTVGFGAGETARITSLYLPDSITSVELCKGVMNAAPYFSGINDNIFQSALFHAEVTDAKNFLRMTDRTYDVIMNDSIHPAYQGNAGLYTLEYFQSAKDRLNPGGVISSWIPLFSLTDESFRMMVNTFHKVFPNSAVLYGHTCLNRHALLIGRKDDKPLFPVDRIGRTMIKPLILGSLVEIGVDEPLDIINFMVVGPKRMDDYLKGAKINTDNHPLLEFDAPKAIFTPDVWKENLRKLLATREIALPYMDLSGLKDPGAFEAKMNSRYIASGQVMDTIASEDFNPERIAPTLNAAMELSPGVAGASYLLKTSNQYADGLSQVTRSRTGNRIALALKQKKVGNLDQAKKILETELKENPDSIEALGNTGDILLEQNKTDEAVGYFKKVLALDENDRLAMQKLGVAYYKKDEYSQSAGWFAKAVQGGQPDAELYVQLGMSLLKSNSFEAAESAFKSAAKTDPGYSRAYHGLATVMRAAKRDPEAMQYYQKAIDLDSRDVQSMGNLGLLYMKMGNFDLARGMFEKILEINPNDIKAKEMLDQLSSQGH